MAHRKQRRMTAPKQRPPAGGQGDDRQPKLNAAGYQSQPEGEDSCGWFKAKRSDVGLELLKANPNALALLYLVAHRARWREGFNVYALKPGQALIGDHENAGLTRQQYRTALKLLTNHDFLTIKPTTKGTVATLINTEVFDVLPREANHQSNQRLTIGQPSANHQPTTNLEGKKESIEEGKTLGNGSVKRFQPPTLPEVLAMFKAEGVDDSDIASSFFDHFASNGWLVGGKSKMKDASAAVRNWIRRGRRAGEIRAQPDHSKGF